MQHFAGYDIELMKCGFVPISEAENAAIDKLKSVFNNIDEIGLKTFQYFVSAKKK